METDGGEDGDMKKKRRGGDERERERESERREGGTGSEKMELAENRFWGQGQR